MKYLKFAVIAVIVVLILNYFHLLSPSFSKKVDDTSTVVLNKSKEEWQKAPFDKIGNDSVIKSIMNGVIPVKFEFNGNGVYSMKGNSLSGTYNSNEPKYIELKFDPRDASSVKQAEVVISLFKGGNFQFSPEQLKGIPTVNMKISKDVNQQYKVESNIPNLKL